MQRETGCVLQDPRGCNETQQTQEPVATVCDGDAQQYKGSSVRRETAAGPRKATRQNLESVFAKQFG